jgi:peptidoglycan hydrolase-like protein with peptidoglycan-binding domain
MAHSLVWLPSVLRNADLKVALVDGWESRGRGDVGTIHGVICHHTATNAAGNMPTLDMLIRGRSDLPGPLAQLGLGRDGTFYVIAAGRANHAGKGTWQGLSSGNTNFIGIEAENSGLKSDFPWPAIQMDAYRRGVAAILEKIGKGPEFCAGHKEYARPIGRKPDPSFDMNSFRASIAAVLNGTAPPLELIPKEEATEDGSGRPTLRRDASGDLVKGIQTKLGVSPANGHFGPKTEAAIRIFQRDHELVPDGIVGPKTWAALDKL